MSTKNTKKTNVVACLTTIAYCLKGFKIKYANIQLGSTTAPVSSSQEERRFGFGRSAGSFPVQR